MFDRMLLVLDEPADRERVVAALRPQTFIIICSDHGTLYGEDGYVGHRIAHPIVTTVPYAEINT